MVSKRSEKDSIIHSSSPQLFSNKMGYFTEEYLKRNHKFPIGLSTTIVMSNLPKSIKRAEIRQALNRLGLRATIKLIPRRKRSKAFLHFETRRAAVEAKKLLEFHDFGVSGERVSIGIADYEPASHKDRYNNLIQKVDERGIRCQHCGEKIASFSKLQVHSHNNKSSTANPKCLWCGIVFGNLDILGQHISGCTGKVSAFEDDGVVCCPICPLVSIDMVNHLRKLHGLGLREAYTLRRET